MAVIVKELVTTTELTNVLVTYYTAANCRTLVDKCTIFNNNTFNVGIVLSLGGTIIKRTIAPKETYLCPEAVGHCIDNGDKLEASTDSGGEGGSGVFLRVSGREVTGI